MRFVCPIIIDRSNSLRSWSWFISEESREACGIRRDCCLRCTRRQNTGVNVWKTTHLVFDVNPFRNMPAFSAIHQENRAFHLAHRIQAQIIKMIASSPNGSRQVKFNKFCRARQRLSLNSSLSWNCSSRWQVYEHQRLFLPLSYRILLSPFSADRWKWKLSQPLLL